MIILLNDNLKLKFNAQWFQHFCWFQIDRMICNNCNWSGLELLLGMCGFQMFSNHLCLFWWVLLFTNVNKNKKVEVTIFRVQDVGKIIMIDELEGGDCMFIIAIGDVSYCCSKLLSATCYRRVKMWSLNNIVLMKVMLGKQI